MAIIGAQSKAVDMHLIFECKEEGRIRAYLKVLLLSNSVLQTSSI